MLMASALCGCGSKDASEPIITKTDIEVVNGQYTPEIMHRLGKVGDPQVSPDGSKILYGVTYTSIEQNKGNRELYLMDIDGSNNVKITNTPKSESNARWIDDSKIIYMRGGRLYTATLAENAISQEVEVAGAEDTFRLAWECARPNAIVTVVALYDKAQTLPLPDMYGKNLIFKTGGVDGCDCDEVLSLIAEGKIDTTPLITHRFALKDIEKAYDIFENKLDGVIKIAIVNE